MKVTCNVCNTTKNIKEEKLEPYRGKTISTKCANKSCTNRIKFKVPLLKEKNKEPKIIKTKSTKQKELKQIKVTPKKSSKHTVKAEKQLLCPNCKAIITEDTNFCMECGHKIIKPSIITNPKLTPRLQKKKCISCGKEYEADEKFCANCGTSKEAKTSKKTPSPKQTIKEVPKKKVPNKDIISTKVSQQPIQNKKKKKRSLLGILGKILIGIVVLFTILIITFIVFDDSKENKLVDGPWKVTATMTNKLFRRTSTNNNGLIEATTKANDDYMATFKSAKIKAPTDKVYESNDTNFLFNQYKPIKKGELYLFTIKNEEMGNGELRVILHLKSATYFEAKAYFISQDEVSIGYLKGNLIKDTSSL